MSRNIKNESDIERFAERMMDHLDRLLLNGDMPQKEYDHAVRDINLWCEMKYNLIRSDQ
jgi:hypothetical protein